MRISALLVLALLLAAPAAANPSDSDRCAIAQAEHSGGFTLQVASFASRDAAERAKATLPGAWISQACVNGVSSYRLNFGRFDSRNGALVGQWDLEDLLASRRVANIDDLGHIVKL